jgi:hypothetical protein
MLAIALVVVSNAFVLIRVGSNRAGAPLETIEVTERELALQNQPEDNSGVTLQITWLPQHFGPMRDAPIDTEKLQELGFDCAKPPGSSAEERRLLPRVAYVVLEYQGAARERWWKERESAARANPPAPAKAAGSLPPNTDRGTRLFCVDASRDANKLLSKYPDRQKYLIVRAVVSANLFPDNAPVKSWHGWVSEIIPSEIHVPLPFARLLSGLGPRAGGEPRYAVTLQYGRNFEPWISDVKLLDKKQSP